MSQLKGKTALVTGSSRGIGKAVCKAYLSHGMKVCIADVLQEDGLKTLKEFQDEYGLDNALFIACDVTVEEDFENAIKKTIEKFGHLDILVNNAGVGNEKHWEKTIEINLIGTMRGTMLAFKYLSNKSGEKGGYVINTGSIAGVKKVSLGPAYCASKHGIVAWTRCWGDKPNVANTNVKMNVVCPAMVDTVMADSILSSTVDEVRAEKEIAPLKPYAMKAEFVAQAFVKLLQDDVTGAVIVVVNDKGHQYYEPVDW